MTKEDLRKETSRGGYINRDGSMSSRSNGYFDSEDHIEDEYLFNGWWKISWHIARDIGIFTFIITICSTTIKYCFLRLRRKYRILIRKLKWIKSN